MRDSFGGGSVAQQTANYTLNYILCYVPVGAGRSNVMEYYDDIVAMAAAILDKIIAIDTFSGGVDLRPLPVEVGIVVTDPSGTEYLGAQFALRVMEFVN